VTCCCINYCGFAAGVAVAAAAAVAVTSFRSSSRGSCVLHSPLCLKASLNDTLWPSLSVSTRT